MIQCRSGDCKKGKSGEKRAFADWCAELKTAFKPHGLLLSAAVSASKTVIDAGYDVPRIAKSMDILNVMTYDFHGSWEKFTGHNAPMYECEGDAISFLNVVSTRVLSPLDDAYYNLPGLSHQLLDQERVPCQEDHARPPHLRALLRLERRLTERDRGPCHWRGPGRTMDPS